MRFRMHALILALITALIGGATAVGISSTAAAQPRSTAPLSAAVIGSAPAQGVTAIARAYEARALVVRAQQARRGQVASAKRSTAAANQTIRLRVVKVARAQLGDRYSAGATGPNSFDCSGLTRYVFKVAAGKELPHQSHAQFSRVKRVSKKAARPGDLVFFFRNGAHHVGVYIGNGRMIDAAGYGKGVRVSPISGSWWSRTFSGIGRILPA